MNPNTKKLISGLIRVILIVSICAYFGADGGISLKRAMEHFFEGSLSKVNATGLVSTIFGISGIIMIYHFVKGVYKIGTWNQYIECFEGVDDCGYHLTRVSTPSNGEFNNIQKALEFRNSKMSMMDNESAAKFLMETSRLNNVMSNEKAASYINSKMAWMDNNSMINFLKGE